MICKNSRIENRLHKGKMDVLQRLIANVGKAKDMESLIAKLPNSQDEASVKEELAVLDEQMSVANRSYRDALQEARSLQSSLSTLLQDMCDDHQEARANLASSAVEDSS